MTKPILNCGILAPYVARHRSDPKSNIGRAGGVRFGSKADMCSAQARVCFTPESDTKCDTGACPLWAKSGHGDLDAMAFYRCSKASRVPNAMRIAPVVASIVRLI